jgi:flagellar basal-body rod protein FlgB
MIDSIFVQPTYVAAKKLLDVTALRHDAIASNLANLETPHYRRVDVDPSFETELRQAMSSQDTSRINSLQPSVSVDTNAVSSRRDGNTVELDSELIHLNQNTLAHTMETQLVSGSLQRLRMAITGRSTA